ncbi:hypothetical protein Unana1_06208 [Umbelopsis nana]
MHILQKIVQSSLVVLAVAQLAVSIPAPFLHTPPMGFNDWSRFECAINQTLFTNTIDAMVSRGLRDAGYKLVSIDDCWPSHERTSNGSLIWNSTIFPNGLYWLSDYIHKNDMVFGIYTDAGNETCGGWPGSLGYEEIDAHTFHSWGVDYLKLDGCNVPSVAGQTKEETYKSIYGNWHTILPELDITFSESAPAYFIPAYSTEVNLTDWYKVMNWVPKYGQLARHSNDIAVYNDYTGSVWASVMTNYGWNVRLARHQKPGYYNDPDLIIAGDPNLTMTEQKSHFALWSSFSAPLILSTDIPALSQEHIDYLTNKDLIALDQDPLVKQATLISQDDTFDMLAKTLANGDRALTILNKSPSTASVTVSLDKLGFNAGHQCEYEVKDLWTGMYSKHTGSIPVGDIPSHGTAVFRITPSKQCKDFQSVGQIFNTFSLNCVTANAGMVSSTNCSAADGQFWSISPHGTISLPFAGSECLTVKGSTVISQKCSSAPHQIWSYGIDGYLINKATSQCLTETGNKITIAKCGDELDSQVFAIPQ